MTWKIRTPADDQTIIIDEKPRKTPMRERNFQRKQEFRARRDVTVKTPTTQPTSTTPATAREAKLLGQPQQKLGGESWIVIRSYYPGGKIISAHGHHV